MQKKLFCPCTLFYNRMFNMIAIICLFSPSLGALLRFTFGMTCLCLTPFCFLRERRHEEWVRWTEAFKAMAGRQSKCECDEWSQVSMVEWLPHALSVSDEIKRCTWRMGRMTGRERSANKWHDGDQNKEEDEEKEVCCRRWSLLTISPAET